MIEITYQATQLGTAFHEGSCMAPAQKPRNQGQNSGSGVPVGYSQRGEPPRVGALPQNSAIGLAGSSNVAQDLATSWCPARHNPEWNPDLVFLGVTNDYSRWYCAGGDSHTWARVILRAGRMRLHARARLQAPADGPHLAGLHASAPQYSCILCCTPGVAA